MTAEIIRGSERRKNTADEVPPNGDGGHLANKPDTLPKSSKPAASLGGLLFTILMICLLLVGIGLLTGFFPLTLLGLTLVIVAIMGGLVIGIWQYARPPKANDR